AIEHCKLVEGVRNLAGKAGPLVGQAIGRLAALERVQSSQHHFHLGARYDRRLHYIHETSSKTRPSTLQLSPNLFSPNSLRAVVGNTEARCRNDGFQA